MSFPLSPTDGQTAVINGTTFSYSSAFNTWTKLSLPVLSVIQDTTSMTPRYPLFAANTSGTIPSVNVDSNDLSYVPGTGTLSTMNLNINSVDVMDYILTYNLAFG
jgi:hypothetical protein